MALLEMREAAYVHRGTAIVSHVTLALEETAHRAFACDSAEAAGVLALMAAGLVRPTSGTVFIAAFDPRIQPVQVKRITGYVPYELVPHEFSSFNRYIEYRAALWGLPRAESVVRARSLLSKLEGVHEQFAYPLAGALLAQPRLLVLDRPQAVYAPQILAAAKGCSIFSTHASERDAERFEASVGYALGSGPSQRR